MLSLIVAYRSFGRFRQASTHLDTPPFSIRHHPGSVIAPRPVPYLRAAADVALQVSDYVAAAEIRGRRHRC